jgi:hypothetical protein
MNNTHVFELQTEAADKNIRKQIASATLAAGQLRRLEVRRRWKDDARNDNPSRCGVHIPTLTQTQPPA